MKKPKIEDWDTIHLTSSETAALVRKLFRLLNTEIFNNELPEISVHINADMITAFCFNSAETAMIVSSEAFQDTGITLSDINRMFREMMYYHCYLNKIKITDPDAGTPCHSEAFTKEVKAHGGICEYYNEAHLEEDLLWKLLMKL